MRTLPVALVVLLLAGCAATPAAEPAPTATYEGIPVWAGWEPSDPDSELVLESDDFTNEGEFPETIRLGVKCGGPNIRPELHWSGLPEGTESVVVTFSYDKTPENRWIAFDLPVDAPLPASADAPAEGTLGMTDRSSTDFFGPCALAGEKFRLWFTVYALDTTLGLEQGATFGEVREAGIGHVLAAAELAGTITGPAE